MKIRNATYHDAPAIKSLMGALGYKTTTSLLVDQIERFFGRNDHHIFICELNKEVVGFISIHYMPQLAFNGELVFISYLSVDESVKNHGVDKALEEYASKEACKRKCDRIQVHFQDWRATDQQFFQQQGYQAYPKFYTKRLVYSE
jgi:N-acetylglutamate synthase-like GNAT family acetyltransferase